MNLMAEKNRFSQFPRQIRASSERADLRYVRQPGCFAVHGPVPASWASAVVLLIDDGRIAVCRGDPGDRVQDFASVTVSPVYALEPNGPPAVPTGLVLVRFGETVRVEDRRGEIERAGYTVKQILSYAPCAAWVAPSAAGIADALAGVDRLEALPDIVNVEPQMLTERVRR